MTYILPPGPPPGNPDDTKQRRTGVVLKGWDVMPDDIRVAAIEAAKLIDHRYDPPNDLEKLGRLITDEAYAAYIIAEAILKERESKCR